MFPCLKRVSGDGFGFPAMPRKLPLWLRLVKVVLAAGVLGHHIAVTFSRLNQPGRWREAFVMRFLDFICSCVRMVTG